MISTTKDISKDQFLNQEERLDFTRWFLNNRTIRFYEILRVKSKGVDVLKDIVFNINSGNLQVTSRKFNLSVYYVFTEILEEYRKSVQQ